MELNWQTLADSPRRKLTLNCINVFRSLNDQPSDSKVHSEAMSLIIWLLKINHPDLYHRQSELYFIVVQYTLDRFMKMSSKGVSESSVQGWKIPELSFILKLLSQSSTSGIVIGDEEQEKSDDVSLEDSKIKNKKKFHNTKRVLPLYPTPINLSQQLIFEAKLCQEIISALAEDFRQTIKYFHQINSSNFREIKMKVFQYLNFLMTIPGSIYSFLEGKILNTFVSDESFSYLSKKNLVQKVQQVMKLLLLTLEQALRVLKLSFQFELERGNIKQPPLPTILKNLTINATWAENTANPEFIDNPINFGWHTTIPDLFYGKLRSFLTACLKFEIPFTSFTFELQDLIFESFKDLDREKAFEAFNDFIPILQTANILEKRRFAEHMKTIEIQKKEEEERLSQANEEKRLKEYLEKSKQVRMEITKEDEQIQKFNEIASEKNYDDFIQTLKIKALEEIKIKRTLEGLDDLYAERQKRFTTYDPQKDHSDQQELLTRDDFENVIDWNSLPLHFKQYFITLNYGGLLEMEYYYQEEVKLKAKEELAQIELEKQREEDRKKELSILRKDAEENRLLKKKEREEEKKRQAQSGKKGQKKGPSSKKQARKNFQSRNLGKGRLDINSLEDDVLDTKGFVNNIFVKLEPAPFNYGNALNFLYSWFILKKFNFFKPIPLHQTPEPIPIYQVIKGGDGGEENSSHEKQFQEILLNPRKLQRRISNMLTWMTMKARKEEIRINEFINAFDEELIKAQEGVSHNTAGIMPRQVILLTPNDPNKREVKIKNKEEIADYVKFDPEREAFLIMAMNFKVLTKKGKDIAKL